MIELVQFFYDLMGISVQANWGDVWGALFLDIVLLCCFTDAIIKKDPRPFGSTPAQELEPTPQQEEKGTLLE